MKDEIMLLLGCGLAAVLVTSACSSMYENEEDVDGGDYDDVGRKQHHRSRYEGYNEHSMMPSAPPVPVPTTEKFSVDYYTEHKKEEKPYVSPLLFSSLVSNEPYIESDYIVMNDYTNNPNGIKTYNEKDASVGLPVNDMTDISAGENNKYIYDRTIGTIGFTSTKIGGRFRGQADYIRGDLPIIPDKTGWFQVSSDPANKLMLGAMNVANGIGQTENAPSRIGRAGAANTLNTEGPQTLDSMRERLSTSTKGKGARAMRMGGDSSSDTPRLPGVLEIMQAGYNQNKADAKALGTTYIAGNPY